MAYNRQKAKARLQRANAESGMSGTSPNLLGKNDDITSETELQEEIEKKYTGKRKRAIRTAQTMKAVAEKLEQEENEKLKPGPHVSFEPCGPDFYLQRLLCVAIVARVSPS